MQLTSNFLTVLKQTFEGVGYDCKAHCLGQQKTALHLHEFGALHEGVL